MREIVDCSSFTCTNYQMNFFNRCFGLHNSCTCSSSIPVLSSVHSIVSMCDLCDINYYFIILVPIYIVCNFMYLYCTAQGLLVNDDLTHIYIFQSSYARSDILLYHVLYQPNVLFFSFFCSRSFVSFLFFGYIFFSCRRRFVNNKELLYS